MALSVVSNAPAQRPIVGGHIRGGPWSGAWAAAAVFIVAILVVGLPLAYIAVSWSRTATNMPKHFTAAIAESMRPRLTMNEIVVNSISDLHKESKLVVFTADVNTDVTREEGISSWGIYWGTNTARVAIRDAHVPFVIDLSKLQTSDFVYNEQAKVLSLLLPRPHIDVNLVSIDPGKIQTLDLRGGWARWDKHDTRDHAIAEIKPKVVIQAQLPFVRELADSGGIDTTTHLLQPLAEAVAKDGITVRIQYKIE